MWTWIGGIICGLLLALVFLAFWSRWCIVDHDEYTKYGRVLYKGTYYELEPSGYEEDINGGILINGVKQGE